MFKLCYSFTVASHHNTYFKTDKLTGKRSKPWRVRFLRRPLQALGIELDDELVAKKWKVATFETKGAAIKYSDDLVNDCLRVSVKARSLAIPEKDRLVEIAAELKTQNLDPIEAIKLGAVFLKGRNYQNSRPFNDSWDGYVKSRLNNDKWSQRVRRQKEKWHEGVKDHFLTKTLSTFETKSAFAKSISKELKRWMDEDGTDRKAKHTLNKHIANLSSFLGYVTHQAEHPFLTPDYLKTLFSEEGRLSVLKLPKGLQEEQANQKLTPAMARVFAKEMALLGPPFSTFMVLKLFAGQRTLPLFRWRWSFIDWVDGKVSIPNEFTKNKKGKVEFGFKNIPNFRPWIEYAYKQVNPWPKDEDRIMTKSQPFVTGHQTAIMNKHQEVFNFPNKGKINGSTDVRNVLRNTFISYSSEKLGVALTQRIVEDRYNLDSYLSSTQSGDGNNAAEFFAITPQSLGLE